jgi:hypothetical protein
MEMVGLDFQTHLLLLPFCDLYMVFLFCLSHGVVWLHVAKGMEV